jgi:VWFA-related protein
MQQIAGFSIPKRKVNSTVGLVAVRSNGKWLSAGFLAVVVFIGGLGAGWAQQQSDQNIPDAPSAVQPPPHAPEPQKPAQKEQSPQQQVPGVPPNQAPPSSANPPEVPNDQPPVAPPPMRITTVPPGSTAAKPGAQEELYKIVRNVNQVIVPVRVTDESGLLVSGLVAKDFSVYENGKKQSMNFFTSDPFALSTAVILDLGLPDATLQKVKASFAALEGAFSQFDQVALYVYDENVTRLADFQAVGRQLDAKLNELRTVSGENNGVPITGGPLGPQGPTVNNVPVGQPTSPVITPSKRAHALNDAILRAALDLGQQDKTRRKVIFVISDGREYRSEAGYNAVLQVLLSNGVLLYGTAVGNSAVPGYRALEKFHIPGQGYSDILPKYANATGGEVLPEYSRSAIEDVYARLMGDARNQYTLGYITRATPSDTRRDIEIRVDRPGCKSSDLRPCVNVFAKAGYYPLPASR